MGWWLGVARHLFGPAPLSPGSPTRTSCVSPLRVGIALPEQLDSNSPVIAPQPVPAARAPDGPCRDEVKGNHFGVSDGGLRPLARAKAAWWKELFEDKGTRA
jgi:hypothetical protein